VVLKVGASDQARRATLSHTASLAGSDAGAAALLSRFGMPRVYDLPTFLETLKLLHCNGYLSSSNLSSISCSGGEASLVADMAAGRDLACPDLSEAQKAALGAALGPMVALSNPLDYHTYVWGDLPKMTAAWLPMAAEHIGLTLVVLDYPHTDPSAWQPATDAAIAVRVVSGRPVAVVATLPELLPEDIAETLMAAGVTPMHGLHEALAAAEVASNRTAPCNVPPLPVGPEGTPALVPEAVAKALLADFGVQVPCGVTAARIGLSSRAKDLKAPLVLKVQGVAHKSEVDGVRVGLQASDLDVAAATMPGDSFLVEEMVVGARAELLIGVTRDAAHGFVLTIGAGGILTELWQDRVSMIVPTARDEVARRLGKLRVYPLLAGYRGAAPVELDAVLDCVMAVQDLVVARRETLHEVEINPLICTSETAIAVDALIACLPD
jgi:acetyl-CoA synthetase